MKQCPRCKQTYSDDNLNFCLEDGEILSGFVREPSADRYADDAASTVILKETRVTNPSNWPSTPPSAPPVQWQGQQVHFQNQQFSAPAFVQSRDTTLPTVSLVLGISGIVLICCYGGIWLGLPAAVAGFLGMRNADADPKRYGGRGMAIGGMVLGVISFLSSLVFAIFMILAS